MVTAPRLYRNARSSASLKKAARVRAKQRQKDAALKQSSESLEFGRLAPEETRHQHGFARRGIRLGIGGGICHCKDDEHRKKTGHDAEALVSHLGSLENGPPGKQIKLAPGGHLNIIYIHYVLSSGPGSKFDAGFAPEPDFEGLHHWPPNAK